jgi:hypothetical protein
LWWEHRALERIKLPRTIASKKLTPRKKVLHRKTKRVKIDEAIIISTELTGTSRRNSMSVLSYVGSKSTVIYVVFSGSVG